MPSHPSGPIETRFAVRRLLYRAARAAIELAKPDLAAALPWEKLLLDDSAAVAEMLPLLAYGIRHGRITPPADWSQMAQLLAAEAAAKVQFTLYSELLDQLHTDCAARSIPLCVLKGMALANDVYPAPWLRPVADLDILAPESRRADLRQLLQARQGVLTATAAEHDRYELPGKPTLIVEVHWSLVNRNSMAQRLLLPTRFLQAPPWATMTYAADGTLRLPPDYRQAYLAVHALKEGFMALKWFIDAELLPPVSCLSNLPRLASNALRLQQQAAALLADAVPAEQQGRRWVALAATGAFRRRDRAMLILANRLALA